MSGDVAGSPPGEFARRAPEHGSSASGSVAADGPLTPVRPVRAELERVDATDFRTALDAPVARAGEAPILPIEVFPEERLAIEELAHDYLMSGAHEVARVLYGGLVALDPNAPAHHLGHGAALHRLGRADAAIRAYERAARVDPWDPVPWVNIAEVLLEERRLEAARRALEAATRRASADDPEHDAIRRKLGALQRLLAMRGPR